jgi:hypothetical protein
MMGVRRTTVTTVAGELQKAGMITYNRGRLRIVDLAQIQKWACECDEDIRSHYRRIFSSNEDSWSESGPDGGRAAFVGRHCSMKPEG